jgi:hypothetical protein
MGENNTPFPPSVEFGFEGSSTALNLLGPYCLDSMKPAIKPLK